MSKSARTQRRYQKAFKGQRKLTGFGFMAPQYDPHLSSGPGPSQSPLTLLQGSRKCSASVLSDPSTDCDAHSEGEVLDDAQDLGVIDECLSESRSEIELEWDPVNVDLAGDDAEVEDGEDGSEIELDLDSVNVDPAGHDAEVEDGEAQLEEVVEGPLDAQDLDVIDEGPGRSENENTRKIQLDLDAVNMDPADHDEEVEDWEAELEEVVEGPKGQIRDWESLHTDIKKHLKKHSKTLPLSQLNQFMIICNFATLQLKGLSWTQASMEIARQWHEGQGNWFA